MHKKKAFSLIEVLVSLSIISMLTVLFLANYRSANRRTDLVMTAQVLVTDIRRAQANALGLISPPTRANPEAVEEFTFSGGWGASFSIATDQQDSYKIFSVYGQAAQASKKVLEQEVKLPKNIIIESLDIDGVKQVFANVVFYPPDPVTLISGPEDGGNYLEIRLKEVISGETKTVRVNFLGLVEVINPDAGDNTIQPINI